MSTTVLRRATVTLLALVVLVGLAAPAAAFGRGRPSFDWRPSPGRPAKSFQPVATFDVMAGNDSAVAEITDVTEDGRTLVYTDSPSNQIGFVDITDPANPVGTGVVDLPGEPTSVVVKGRYAVVGVNTSVSFTDPSGQLVVVDIASRTIVASKPLPGQPDSLALSPLGWHIAVVIENERDEDLDDGFLPQLPSGGLVKVTTFWSNPNRWSVEEIDLSKVAANAADGTDLEPEFVDINLLGEAAVTFQENNHLAIVNLWTNRVTKEFSAGTVDLDNIDTEENDLLEFTSSLEDRRREPDALVWTGIGSFVTANEGDYEDPSGEAGGSRGFTLFDRNGKVRYESAESFEHELARAGHYPEGRSENKGVEPESVEFARYGGDEYLFVGSERGNAVGVYEMKGNRPRFTQLLPTGIGPEGLKAIPDRNLFVASTETDVADAGIPTMINIYALQQGGPSYPELVSTDVGGAPIGWVAMSGLAGDPSDQNRIHAVSDGFLAEGFVYEVRVDKTPAEIVERTQITGASASLDLEGIAFGPAGSMWLGSEGNADDTPNLVLEADPDTGAVLREFALPAELEDAARSNGIEGIAVTGEPGAEIVHVAIQRAWPDSGDVNGAETKIGRLDVATGEWTFALYPLQPAGAGDWIGLSELTPLPDGTFAVIERDKGWGPTTGFNAELKALYGVDLAGEDFRTLDDPRGLETVRKGLLRDLLPDLADGSIWTPEKVEGLAVAGDGQVYVVTDNDGVDDATGETRFLRLGGWTEAFAPLDLPERPAFELTVHHFNDGESDLLPEDGTGAGSISRFGSLLAQLQAGATIGDDEGQVTVSAGDNFLAGPEWTASLESGTFYDAVALGYLDIDAFTIGNHEFDFGPEVLADFIAAFPAEDTFISSNLDVGTVPALAALAADGRIAKSVVVEEKGEQIGIVGATTPALREVSSPGDVGIDEDVAAAVQAEVDTLTAAGIDKILVSTHLQDITNEQALAGMLDDVDAIIGGGGGEDIAGGYPLTATDVDGTVVPIVTVPGDYFDIGQLTLGFDAEGNVIAFGGELVPVTGDLPEDTFLRENVEAPVEAFLATLDATVIADTTVGLNGIRNDVRTRETNLGNIVADAFLASGQEKAAEFGVASPVVALSNGGGIRNDSVLAPGELTLLDTFDVAPFGNFVAVIPDLSHADLKAAMEHGLAGLPGSAGSFGQWSGLVVEYDVTQPAGSRVVDVELADGTAIVVGGVVVSPSATISIATSAFLAAGQDGYDMFEPYDFTSLGVTDQQALASRLGVLGTVATPDPVEVADRSRIIPV